MKIGERGIVSSGNISETRSPGESAQNELYSEKLIPYALVAKKLARLRKRERAALKREPTAPAQMPTEDEVSFNEEHSFSNCMQVELLSFERVCTLDDAGHLTKHVLEEGSGVNPPAEGDLVCVQLVEIPSSTFSESLMDINSNSNVFDHIDTQNKKALCLLKETKPVWKNASVLDGSIVSEIIPVLISMRQGESCRVLLAFPSNDDHLPNQMTSEEQNDTESNTEKDLLYTVAKKLYMHVYIRLIEWRSHRVSRIQDGSTIGKTWPSVRLDVKSCNDGPTSLLEASHGCLTVATLKCWIGSVESPKDFDSMLKEEATNGNLNINDIKQIQICEAIVRQATKGIREDKKVSNLMSSDESLNNLQLELNLQPSSSVSQLNSRPKNEKFKVPPACTVLSSFHPFHLFADAEHPARTTIGWLQGSGCVPGAIESLVTNELRSGQRSLFAMPLKALLSSLPVVFNTTNEAGDEGNGKSIIFQGAGEAPERWKNIVKENLVELVPIDDGVATDIHWGNNLQAVDFRAWKNNDDGKISSSYLEKYSVGDDEDSLFVLLDIALEGVVWQVREVYCLPESERIARAEYHRDLGNKYYKDEQFVHAVAEYNRAMDALRFSVVYPSFNVTDNIASNVPGQKFIAPPNEEDEEWLTDVGHIANVRTLASAVALNLSMTFVRVRKFRDAVNFAELGSSVDPNSGKAKYRLAQAYLAMDDTKRAIVAADEAILLGVEAAAKAVKNEAMQRQKKHEECARKMFSGLFTGKKAL